MGLDFLGSYYWNWWAVPYWLSFFISLILTILLVAMKRNDRSTQLYILNIFFVSLISLGAAMATNSTKPNVWLFWMKLSIFAGAFAMATAFHFSSVFLKQRPIFESKKILFIYIIPLGILTLLIINPKFFYSEVVSSDLSSTYYGLYDWINPPIENLWSYYFLFYGIMLLLVTINFYRAFRQTEDLEMRRRASYFILASLFLGISLTFSSLVQYFDYVLKLEPTTVLLSINGMIITYGILKARLFDIDLIVSKSVKYTLLNIGLAWLFVISRETMIPLISIIIFSGNQVATLLAGFIVMTAFVPLKNITSSFTEKLFPQKGHVPSSVVENQELYRRQLMLIWEDGKITEKEQKILSLLRSFLEISEDVHNRLKQEVLHSQEKNLERL